MYLVPVLVMCIYIYYLGNYSDVPGPCTGYEYIYIYYLGNNSDVPGPSTGYECILHYDSD